MIRRLDLPDAPSPAGAGVLEAPAAARNLDPIRRVLVPNLPRQGRVLELAAGTGQHVAAWAAHRPDLTFLPTEPDADRRASIDARCAGLSNVAPATALDACRPGWSAALDAPVEAILLVNLLHLISDAEMAVLLDEATQALAPGGLFAIYGPFLRGHAPVSDGDRAFDARLRAQDPAIGYKDRDVVVATLDVLGLTVRAIEMPANNLMLLARSHGALR